MAGIVRFYYDEKNEDVFEASTLTSFKITKIDDSHLSILISTTGKNYKFDISSDVRWQNNLSLIIEFLNRNFEKVLNDSNGCKIDTFEARYYVNFYFYEDFEGDWVDNGQFTGVYVK